MEFSEQDHCFMARALQLAARGLYSTDPNPRVGCVLVREGIVVGEGWHERAGGPHAEIAALRDAGDAARDAVAYVTLEPCCHQGRTPPCSDALIAAGIKTVIAAMPDPNPLMAGKGLGQLQAAGLSVASGLNAAQAAALNPGYIRRMQSRRPWVRCKMAMSLDGGTASSGGESKWITSADARQDGQQLRARSSAIMTGIGTVLADDPAMNVRRGNDEQQRQPLRVVVDSQLRISPQARTLQLPGEVLIATACADQRKIQALQRPGVQVCQLPGDGGRVDLAALLAYLAAQQNNEVLLEAGATLSGAMISAGLVDELIVYMAPRLLGDRARGLFTLPGVSQLADAVALAVQDIRAVGDDWRITARVAPELSSDTSRPNQG